MNTRERASEIQMAIWLIGIGILWYTDLWWPGILILIGISQIVKAAMVSGDRPAREVSAPVILPEEELPAPEPVNVDDDGIPDPGTGLPAPTPIAVPTRFIPADPSWLPTACPACGGPLREVEVNWLGEKQAVCPFCDTVLEPGKNVL